ncbi:hypothetical protein CEXT_767511 [Caerostris extrusa]|uniref:Uncharacterized protein n=1 Tax=Caerostris extrusa TaxID=172846 RepID=A0AAV4XPQ9_CAEEX|nr:hypothetical protein CEXT_767511 [Caerostris extrusa]
MQFSKAYMYVIGTNEPDDTYKFGEFCTTVNINGIADCSLLLGTSVQLCRNLNRFVYHFIGRIRPSTRCIMKVLWLRTKSSGSQLGKLSRFRIPYVPCVNVMVHNPLFKVAKKSE